MIKLIINKIEDIITYNCGDLHYSKKRLIHTLCKIEEKAYNVDKYFCPLTVGYSTSIIIRMEV